MLSIVFNQIETFLLVNIDENAVCYVRTCRLKPVANIEICLMYYMTCGTAHPG